MAAELEETPVSYEELSDLENEFDEVETEIIRQQYGLSKSLYVKRAALVAKIPHFWPLVFEQAPMDIDEYIQPSDSAVLLASLKSISVSRFELDEDEKNGDPRSVAIRFEFADNEHFENKVLEKKFWWRQSTDGFAGLVSEPVEIKWKKGKDLTDGLLALVKAVYDEQVAKPKEPTPAKGTKKEKVPLTANQQALKDKMESTGMGGVSFFAWFGYVGEYVTAEESKIAVAKEKEERQKRKNGEEVKKDEDEEMGEDDDEEEDDEDDWEDDQEIFPTGDAIAMAIADDLWPGALKYFIQAQEQDMMSDLDFESDDDEDEEEGEEGAKRSGKKHKACAHGCAH